MKTSEDPANGHEGKPDGEDRAEDCPYHPAHLPSMRPMPSAGGGHGDRGTRSRLGGGRRQPPCATAAPGTDSRDVTQPSGLVTSTAPGPTTGISCGRSAHLLLVGYAIGVAL